MLGVWTKWTWIARALLQMGACVHGWNEEETTIEGACFCGNLEIVKLLLEYGAEITEKCIYNASSIGNSHVSIFLVKIRPELSDVYLNSILQEISI